MDRFELLIYSVFGVLCALGITAAIGYKIAAYLDKRHDGNGNGGGRDRHLRRDRRHGHRALRADVVFNRYVVDDRKQRIDGVPRSA